MKPATVAGDSSSKPLLLTALSYARTHLLLVLFSAVILRGLYKRYASPLRHIPGPFIASCTRAWKVWIVYRGHNETEFIKLHKKYGPVVRISPDEISFSSLNAAKDIFTVGKGFHKTDFYSVFPPKHAPDIFTEVREWKHAQMKRFAVTPYSLTSMQKRATTFDEVEKDLIEKLDGFANGPGRVDLGTWLHYFAFDVLGEIAFSRRFGFLATGTDVEGSIQMIDDVQWYDGIVGQVVWWDDFLRNNPLRPYLPFWKPTTLVMTRFAAEELKRRKKANDFEGGDHDLMGQLLKAHSNNPDKFSEDDVFSIAHGAVFAGSDSTASTMQSFLYHVLSVPAIYSKLIAEIDEAQKSGQLSEMVTYAEAQNLPYFQACLKEAMRVRPAVGVNIVRHVPPEGAEIDGTMYPGKTRVALNGWVLHRDQGVFGKDADDYRPERWIEGDAKMMERHMYQFGGGSHLCIGRNMALYEMNKVLPQLLREYKLELVHAGRPLQYHTTFFVVQHGLEVYLQKRARAK